ncbi:MAG: hypothetical protein K2P92_08970, partial [Bdellovibrionaceae bacterium]|nr:hypothetical protein [Pseudobdellovibrionaceae bacterium]
VRMTGVCVFFSFLFGFFCRCVRWRRCCCSACDVFAACCAFNFFLFGFFSMGFVGRFFFFCFFRVSFFYGLRYIFFLFCRWGCDCTFNVRIVTRVIGRRVGYGISWRGCKIVSLGDIAKLKDKLKLIKISAFKIVFMEIPSLFMT